MALERGKPRPEHGGCNGGGGGEDAVDALSTGHDGGKAHRDAPSPAVSMSAAKNSASRGRRRSQEGVSESTCGTGTGVGGVTVASIGSMQTRSVPAPDIGRNQCRRLIYSTLGD